MVNPLEFNGMFYGVNLEEVIDTNENVLDIISEHVVDIEKLEKLTNENGLNLFSNDKYAEIGKHKVKNVYIGEIIEIENEEDGIGKIKWISNLEELIGKIGKMGLKVTNMDFSAYTYCEGNLVKVY